MSSVKNAAAGDMVIEYCGEVVRPSVADARERRLYNTLVGAGTYVFRMTDVSHPHTQRSNSSIACIA